MNEEQEAEMSSMMAMVQWLKNAGADPIGTWGAVAHDMPFNVAGNAARLQVMRQLATNAGAGRRLDRARNRSPRDKAEMHFVMGQFEVSDDPDGPELGFIYFTDEAAADYLRETLGEDSIDLDMVRNIRKKYSIKKLPEHLLKVRSQ